MSKKSAAAAWRIEEAGKELGISLRDIPYKALSHREASALASPLSKGDSQRFCKELAKIGGMDGQEVEMSLLCADVVDDWTPAAKAAGSMESERFARRAELMRSVLARCPPEVFDEMAAAMNPSRLCLSHVRVRAMGISREPRAFGKLLAACARAGEEANVVLAISGPLLMASDGPGPDGAGGRAGEVEAELLAHFASLPAKQLAKVKGRAEKIQDQPLLAEAGAIKERRALAKAVAARRPAKAAPAPARPRGSL